MTQNASAHRARLWQTIEDAIREDERAIDRRVSAARRTLAAGKPITIDDKDTVPDVGRYFPADVLDDVESTEPPRSAVGAVDELLNTISAAAVLHRIASDSLGLVDSYKKIAARADGDAAEAVELHLGHGIARYGWGDDAYEGRRQFLAQEVDTAWAMGETYPYTAELLAEREDTTRQRWSVGFQMLGLPRPDTHAGMLELAGLAPHDGGDSQQTHQPSPPRLDDVAVLADMPSPYPRSVAFEIAPVVTNVVWRGRGRPEDSATARQTAEGAHFANLLTEVERFFFCVQDPEDLEFIGAFHSGSGLAIEVRLRDGLTRMPAEEAAAELRHALQTARIPAVVRPYGPGR